MADKFALIIGNSRYEDARLSRLKAPDVDVRELERVLKSPDVGQFTRVDALVNEDCATVRKAVARFYDQRKRDDLLFLYFSGHGVKDDQGHLYLALRDTEIELLAGTAIESAFVSARMDRSFSKRQVLVLDCCHSGAFAHDTKGAQGVSVGTAEAFEGIGQGRVILTATDAMQYAWDGDRVDGHAPQSVFTRYLIDGLNTGAADEDGDGVVTVDELYDYVHQQVLNATPRQTPHKWSYQQQGEIVLARNPFVKRAPLPSSVAEAIVSPSLEVRLRAVQELTRLLGGDRSGEAHAALAALKELSQDDSRRVANAAIDVLKAHDSDRRGRRTSVPALPESRSDGSTARPQGAEVPADDQLENRPSDVFISYAREDRGKAKALASVLSERGWTIWWDRKIAPGESFDKAIEQQLKTCKCAIVLWSTHSVEATWVRNEARRAAKRNVLVPILIECVEAPLEFENLQAADLTSWEAPAEHFEFETLFNRIEELAGVPHDVRARTAVERARREFTAGRQEAAMAALAEFQPPHALVTAGLSELRREMARIAQEQAARRLAEEMARRERALASEQSRLEELLKAGHVEAAGRALESAEAQFGATALAEIRERWMMLRAQGLEDERARTAVETARRQFAAGRHEEAVAGLAEFNPVHALVTAARDDLQRRADQITQEQDLARRAQEAAQRARAGAAGQSRVQEAQVAQSLEGAAARSGSRLRRALLAAAAAVPIVLLIAWLGRQPSIPPDRSDVLPNPSPTSKVDQPPVENGLTPSQPLSPAETDSVVLRDAQRQVPSQDQRQGSVGTTGDRAVEKRQEDLRSGRSRDAETSEEQRRAAEEAERQAAQKAADAQRVQDAERRRAEVQEEQRAEAERQRRLQEQRADAERQARLKAATEAQKEAIAQAEKEAAAQAEKEAAARRFFATVTGAWTHEEEQRAQQSRTRTEDVLTLDPNCSGVLTRVVTTYERGFAGWKTVGSESRRLTIQCDATGVVSGDVNSRVSRDGATLLLGTSRFVRR